MNTTDLDSEVLNEISKKLNVLLSIQFKLLLNNKELSTQRKKGAGELVHYLASFDLNPKDIAEIVGSPLTSVRTLLTPQRRKG